MFIVQMFYERQSRYESNNAWNDIVFSLARKQRNVRDPSLIFEFDDEEQKKRTALVCVPYCGAAVLNYLEEDLGDLNFVNCYNELMRKKWVSAWWRSLCTGIPFPPSIHVLKAEFLTTIVQDERVMLVLQKHFRRPFVLVFLSNALQSIDYVYRENIEFEFCSLHDVLEFLGKFQNLSIFSNETMQLLMTE